jgi:hypothetical protein
VLTLLLKVREKLYHWSLCGTGESENIAKHEVRSFITCPTSGTVLRVARRQYLQEIVEDLYTWREPSIATKT